MSYVLVLFLYAGTFSSGDSVALTNIGGFKTEQSCISAGKQAMSLPKGTMKEGKFVCLKQD